MHDVQVCNTLHTTYVHHNVYIISFSITILQKCCHKLLIMETGQVHAKFQNALVMQCARKSTFACMCTHYFSEDCNKCDYRVVKVSHARQWRFVQNLLHLFRVKFTAKHTLHDSFQLEWKNHTTLIGASGEYAIIMVGEFLRKREHHNHRHRYVSAHSGIELQNR